MKGVVFLGDGKCEVREFPDPRPEAGQVVIRMKASGICGSDLWRYKMTPARLRHSVIPGHEPCGIVEAIGHGVRNVNVGGRVSVYHLLACGHCKYCLSGDLMFCPDYKAYGQDIDGSHADFLITEERNVLPLPEELSFADGVSFIMPIYMYWDIVRFLIDKGISLERMVTHRFPIQQADEAFKLFAERKIGKVVFEWP